MEPEESLPRSQKPAMRPNNKSV